MCCEVVIMLFLLGGGGLCQTLCQHNSDDPMVADPRSAQIPPDGKSRSIFPYYLTGGIWADRGSASKIV
eukprot:COSAG02_NODE_973_length_15536_cov_5.108635_1_plen_69_part_00